MAKTVQPIAIELGIKGGEKLAALNRSFRDLSKQVKLSDADITQATKDIVKFATEAGNSEATIRGQIKALEGLQKQAELGGKVFTQLQNDIKALGGVLYGASAAVEAKRKSLVDLGSSANATTAQIQSAIKALTVLRNETRLDSEAFDVFGQSINKLAERFEKAKQEAQDFSNAQARSGRVISASSGAAKQQIKDLDLVTQALREQREELGRLEGEARIRRGVADLAEREAVSSSTRSYEQALAESVLSGTPLKKLLSTKDIRAALAEVELQIAELQKQVETKLSRGMQISFQEIARSARESARAMAAAFADPEFLNVLSRLDERIGTLPNTTAGYSQRLRELEQQLANTDRSSENYRRVSEEISKVQKELAKDVYGYSEALEQLAVSQENAARRAEKLRGIGEYVASVSGLGATAAAGRAGTPMVGAIGGYRDPATGAMIATGRGMRRDRMAYQESQELERVASAQGDLEQAFNGAIETYRSSLQTIQDLQAKRHEEFMSQVAAEDAAQKKAFQEQQSREEREYQRRVAIGRQMRTGEFASRRLIGMPNQELSQLYGGIVRIGQADQMRQLEMMGRGYDEVANDIRKVTAASNGSVSSLNAQRSAWSSLRDILDPAGQQFKEVTREIERVDKALEKTQRRRRGMSPMQMTQAAGAAISGGIFGGPEGFLGGAIGAIGGVGGAFAGAAIGAQVGGLRRQLGEFADYAAGIQRLQIALKGVAGSQSEFNKALLAARNATDSLNVPQETAIQGITRLTAAVKGAGGNVSDASLAFRNISSAIIATGGGAEQVEGAITALVQIFSKGKVSMEEINQIAERLPGTFNTFAKAAGMTGPEMLKALQQGKVGLNDLMSFLIEVGNKYNATASSVADSSQSAGARLQVAFNDMRIAVGEALQPIGAEFQSIFTNFIEDISPAMVAVLPKIGEAVLALAKNLDVLAISAGTAFAAMGVAKIAAIGGLSAALLKLAAAAGAASVALKGTAAAALLNPWVALAAGIGAATAGVIRYYQAQNELNAFLDEGTASTKTIKNEITRYELEIKRATDKIKGINGEQRATGREAQRLKSNVAELRAELERLRGTYSIRIKLERQGYTFDAAGAAQTYTVSGVTYDVKTGAPISGQEVTDFQAPAVDSESESAASKKAARDAERRAEEIASLRRAYDALFANRQILTIQMQQIDAARDLKDAQDAYNQELADEITVRQSGLQFEKEIIEARNKYEARALEIKETLEGEAALTAELYEKEQLTQKLAAASGKQFGRIKDINADITREIKEQNKAIQQQLIDRRKQLGLISEDEYNAALMEREGRRLREQFPREAQAPQRAELLDLYRQEIDPTTFEKVQQNIAQLKGELGELVKSANQITNAATAIGDAFAQSFTSAISGASTAKEALADFFQSVGSYFLDMAKQIIAKMITMAILNSVAKVLPGLGSNAGSGFNLTGFGNLQSDAGSGISGFMAGAGGILGRASGGPVNANQPYIVGERGPELFMPSSSGMVMSNENLQAQNRAFLDSIYTENGEPASDDAEIESQATAATQAAVRGSELEATAATRDAIRENERIQENRMQIMSQQKEFDRRYESERIQENRMQIMSQQKEFDRRYERERIEQMASTPGKLNIKYESQVINSVEYVTREQAERMAAQSALRGRELAIGSLQNSVKTRKLVGMS